MSQTPIKVCIINRKGQIHVTPNAQTARAWVKVNQFSAVKNVCWKKVPFKNGLYLQIILFCKSHPFGLSIIEGKFKHENTKGVQHSWSFTA